MAKLLSRAIEKDSAGRAMTFMEVCGTHTMAIARYGLRALLPENIRMISGPGCPVCVTPQETVDHAVALSRIPDVVIATFGDMMKVPGSQSSLEQEHARGGEIRMVTSTLEALTLAGKEKEKRIIFLGVGFETTIPTVAASLVEARRRSLGNFFVLSGHKVMPPAMEALAAGKKRVDGYLCPGHVSAIIGSRPYAFLAQKYRISCVISGFEPLDILQSIAMLVRQVSEGMFSVENQYSRAVKPEGNPAALALIEECFTPCDSVWRGIGSIPSSGLAIRDSFSQFDAAGQIPVVLAPAQEPAGCICGSILQGISKPMECVHFGKSCTPDHPVGPCMVSSEGTCAAYFKYGV